MTAGGVPCVTGHVAPSGGKYCTQCGVALGPGDQVTSYGAVPIAPAATPPGTGKHAATQYPATQYPATQYPAAQYDAPDYANTPPVNRAMNGMAIASMVLGILWIEWIGSILALVFGYVALNQIKTRNERGRGMAIAGVALGWIGVGLILVIFIVNFIRAVRSGSGG